MDGVEFQSKMLVAFLKAFKVDPSVEGLIRAVNGDPADVYAAVQFLQKNAPQIAKTVLETGARMQRIEAEQARQAIVAADNNAMLIALCKAHNIAHVSATDHRVLPAEVTQALLVAAGA